MGFKDPKFDDRQRAAMDAKKALLEKFKAKPGPGHPEYEAKKKEREAMLAARAERDVAGADTAEREGQRGCALVEGTGWHGEFLFCLPFDRLRKIGSKVFRDVFLLLLRVAQKQ